jgi:FKBP-type peptidyl-prolyl cis-trans isomerase
MRQLGILLLCGSFLAFVAWQARTGVFRRANPSEPASKHMRAAMEKPQVSEADAAILRTQYGTARVNSSGLRYIVHAPGAGAPPAPGSEVVVHYDGYLLDGTKIDSSRDRGSPYVFRLGARSVILGWEEGVGAMKPGEKRTLLVPWWLGYGEAGQGLVPSKAMLRFEIELLEIR